MSELDIDPDDESTRGSHIVAWRLRGDQTFSLIAEGTIGEVLEHMFTVCNGMAEGPDAERWAAAMAHRLLSTGDNVNVDGQPWHCDSVGWHPATELDSVDMEDRIGRMFDIPRDAFGDLGL